MADDRKIIIENGKYLGVTSFTGGMQTYDSSEKDIFYIREASRNPEAVINRLIRTGGNIRIIEGLIYKYGLANQFEDKLMNL